jgi:hypothetical protein
MHVPLILNQLPGVMAGHVPAIHVLLAEALQRFHKSVFVVGERNPSRHHVFTTDHTMS